jgi:hypothetical protein
MMSSSIWIVACPLGMFAMGGIAWGFTRLPGRRAERLAPVSSRTSGMTMGSAKQQPAAVGESTPGQVPGHV